MLSRLFLRGRSVSEKDSAPLTEIEASRRPSTVPNSANNFISLASFADALPDSHKDLFRKFIQEEVIELHRFSDLPEKVRLKIWVLALPKEREIRLRVQYELGDYTKREFGFPAPATLYVNKESRAETVKHCHFFEQNLAFRIGKMPSLRERPICYCISPSTDNISIGFQSLFNAHFSLFLKTMYLYIPKCMDAIRVLEIVDVYQSGYAHQESNCSAVRQFLIDNIARFHYLDEVRFILNNREELDYDIMSTWKKKVIKALAREKKKHPEYHTPKVICVSWKVREAVKFLGIEHRP